MRLILGSVSIFAPRLRSAFITLATEAKKYQIHTWKTGQKGTVLLLEAISSTL